MASLGRSRSAQPPSLGVRTQLVVRGRAPFRPLRALLGALFESLPEFLFQGYAVLLQMKAGEMPSNVQLLSILSTVFMLFVKLISKVLSSAQDH